LYSDHFFNQKDIMFIKLTNASPAHAGKQLALQKNSIVSVYRDVAVREDKSLEDVTFVFVPPHGMWEVQESFEEVMKLLK